MIMPLRYSTLVASWLCLSLSAAAAAAAVEDPNTTNNDEIKQWLHDNKAPSTMIHYKYEPEDAFVPSGNECISELYDIQQAEERLSIKDILLSKPRTYILCPNTVYDIADSFDQDRRPRNDKQSPLVLGRSHIYIKCGSTGSSDNKCVFRGGHFQVHMSPLFLTKRTPTNEEGDELATTTINTPNNKDNRPIQNAVLQGITFTEADSFNILAEYPGELTILDCVFENNKAISLIFGHILDKDRTDQSLRRHLQTKHSFQEEWKQQRLRRSYRRLQTSSTTYMLDIRVMDCLFEVSKLERFVVLCYVLVHVAFLTNSLIL